MAPVRCLGHHAGQPQTVADQGEGGRSCPAAATASPGASPEHTGTPPPLPISHPQVPNFVAKRWKGACEGSAARGEAQGPPLATLRLVQAADEGGGPPKTQYQLQLDGEAAAGGQPLIHAVVLCCRAGDHLCAHTCRPLPAPRPSLRAAAMGRSLPQDFVMRNTTKHADPMLAFSDRGGELGEPDSAAVCRWAGERQLHEPRLTSARCAAASAAAEGKVWQKFDCEVARRAAPGGAGAAGKVRGAARGACNTRWPAPAPLLAPMLPALRTALHSSRSVLPTYPARWL